MTATRKQVSAALLENLGKLQQYLETEQEALRTRDFDLLTSTVESKRNSLEAIGRLVAIAERESWLSDDAAGQAIRDVLRERLADCQALNETSGAVIAEMQHSNQAALGLLGIDTSPARYEATGTGVAAATNRSLGVG